MYETDEEVYSRFLNGEDREALGELLERYGASLTLFLRGYVDSIEDAEDLMMDSFVAIAMKKEWTAKGSSFKTWLFAIGRKLALKHNRKKRRTAASLDQWNTGRTEPGEAASEGYQYPETELLKQEQNQQLYRAMENLHAEYREVLFLLYFEQMTYEEAGVIMRKNKKQMYHLAERGKQALRQELTRMGFDYGPD